LAATEVLLTHWLLAFKFPTVQTYWELAATYVLLVNRHCVPCKVPMVQKYTKFAEVVVALTQVLVAPEPVKVPELQE
jgi:hypothetical protein